MKTSLIFHDISFPKLVFNYVLPAVSIMYLSKRVNKISFGVIVFLIFLIPVFNSSAHTEGGGTFETEVGDYFIDIGYYPQLLEANVPARLDFEVSHRTEKIDVPYTNVWVRIEKGTKTIFATGVYRPEFGTTGLLYTFGEPGIYTVYARFQNSDESIVETTFPLEILEDPDTPEPSLLDSKIVTPVASGLLGLIVGAVMCFIIQRRVNKKKGKTHAEVADSN